MAKISNSLFDPAREGFLIGEIDWDTAVIKAALVRGYTFDATDKFVSDVTGSGGTLHATSAALASKTATNGVADAADVTFTTPAVDANDHSVLIFQSSAVGGGADVAASAQRVIAWIDTATGLPIRPNGANITLSWDNGANKRFSVCDRRGSVSVFRMGACRKTVLSAGRDSRPTATVRSSVVGSAGLVRRCAKGAAPSFSGKGIVSGTARRTVGIERELERRAPSTARLAALSSVRGGVSVTAPRRAALLVFVGRGLSLPVGSAASSSETERPGRGSSARAVAPLPLALERVTSTAPKGQCSAMSTDTFLSSATDDGTCSIASSWKKSWVGLCFQENGCIIRTASATTIGQRISNCGRWTTRIRRACALLSDVTVLHAPARRSGP